MKFLNQIDGADKLKQDSNNRLVTDAEKANWNSKAEGDHNHSALYEPKNTNIQGHISNQSNPHNVSKAQVGLGNVDNTSDLAKPISTATQAALNEKVDNSRVLTDVPLNAKFTDTNTTYSEISTAEIDAGTASTGRTITGRRVKYILDKVGTMISTAISGLTKTNVGLGNVDNTSDINKPISTATQTALDGKVNNSQVLTSVPSGAKFTDTITTINGKTGVISKADIVALGIPAQDTNTTYTAGTGLTLTGTVFTPTFGTTAGTVTQGNDSRLSNARTPLAHTHTRADITDLGSVAGVNTNASTTQYLRGDGTWATPPNTTYSAMSVAEGTAGTATSSRTVRADYLKQIINSYIPTSLPANGGNASTVNGFTVGTNVPANAKFTDTVYTHPGSGTNPHGTTKADVGLGSVLNYGISTEAEAQTGTSNAKYMTPLRTKQAIDNTNTIHVGSSAPSSTKIGWVDTSL